MSATFAVLRGFPFFLGTQAIMNRAWFTIQGDASYPAGGYTANFATLFQVGLPEIGTALIVNFENTGGIWGSWNRTTSKVQLYGQRWRTMFLTQAGKDIKGSGNTDSPNVDLASEPTNGHLVAALTAVAGAAWACPALTNPDRGRNVCITISNDSGGPLNLYEGTMGCTVIGTWRGLAQTEVIPITSTAANKAMVTTKFRVMYGLKPFDTVSSIVVDHVPDNNIKIGAGVGSKVGLYNDIAAVTDVTKVTKTAAHLATTSIVDITYMTVNLGTLADNNDFAIVYKAFGPNLILSYGCGDLKGSANTDSENADSAAEPTNGHLVAALTAVAAGAWTCPAITNPDIARNVCITVQNASGGALDLYEGISTFIVIGTRRGRVQTESITITSTAGNKAVANTKFRYKYGLLPFDTVTSVTVDNEPADVLKIGVGIGSKLGLPSNLATPSELDIVKLTKNAAHLSPVDILHVANVSINFGTLADADDITVHYRPGGPDLFLTHWVGDIKGSDNTDAENADSAAEPTNGHLVAALTAVAAGAWTCPAITNPDIARNLCVTISNDTVAALNLYEGVTTVAIVGTYRGQPQTESVIFTSTAGNKAVAAAQFRYKYGLKPFDTVTAVTITNLPANTLKIGVGVGSKIALPAGLAAAVVNDVVKLTKTAVHLAPSSSIVDTTNDTVSYGTLTDGNDIAAVIRTKGPEQVDAEVSPGTDLSGVTLRAELIWE